LDDFVEIIIVIIFDVTFPRRMEARGYINYDAAYYPRAKLHLRDLPENHIKRVK